MRPLADQNDFENPPYFCKKQKKFCFALSPEYLACFD